MGACLKTIEKDDIIIRGDTIDIYVDDEGTYYEIELAEMLKKLACHTLYLNSENEILQNALERMALKDTDGKETIDGVIAREALEAIRGLDNDY
jgi:hypothetical protein